MPEGWFHGEAGSSTGGPPVFDAAATADSGGGLAGNLTWNHTVGTGTNRILVMAIGAGSGSFAQSAFVDTFALTQLGRVFSPSGSVYIDVWYYLNPPSGVRSLQYNTSSAVRMSVVSTTYSDADQTTPFGSQTTSNSNGATSTSTTLTAATTDLVLSALFVATAGAVGAGGSQNVRGDVVSSPFQTAYSDQAGGVGVTSSFSWASSTPMAQLSVPLHGASPSVFEGWS